MQVRTLLESIEFVMVPVVNPDGYKVSLINTYIVGSEGCTTEGQGHLGHQYRSMVGECSNQMQVFITKTKCG